MNKFIKSLVSILTVNSNYYIWLNWYLFAVVSNFCRCLNKHNIQFFCFAFTFIGWYLTEIYNMINEYRWTDNSIVYRLSTRSVLLPTNIIITSLPRSVRTSLIHFEVWWNEFESKIDHLIPQLSIATDL
jgi:hypothetical protein